jgi:hypothetical protein
MSVSLLAYSLKGAADATNYGQWRASFQVVIAASNGYVKNPPPASIPDFEGPTELAGAINAPLDAEGDNTYLGVSYYPITEDQSYDPANCASDCLTHNQYVQTHDSDWTYELCLFFNAYVLSENGVAQGKAHMPFILRSLYWELADIDRHVLRNV